jgi:hypothetical protein
MRAREKGECRFWNSFRIEHYRVGAVRTPWIGRKPIPRSHLEASAGSANEIMRQAHLLRVAFRRGVHE